MYRVITTQVPVDKSAGNQAAVLDCRIFATEGSIVLYDSLDHYQ